MLEVATRQKAAQEAERQRAEWARTEREREAREKRERERAQWEESRRAMQALRQQREVSLDKKNLEDVLEV